MDSYMLLHGLPGTGAQWEYVTEELGGYAVVAPTFRGFSVDETLADFPTTKEHAQQIVDWCDGETADLTIVAWSFSCHPLLYAMAEMGLRPARAILIEPSADVFLDECDRSRFGADAATAFGPLFQQISAADNTSLARLSFEASGGLGAWEQLDDSQRRPFIQSAIALRRAFASGAAPDPIALDKVSEISVPVEILLGAESREMFELAARRLCGLIGSAQLHIIPDADHLWPVTRPEALAAWLSRHNFRDCPAV